MLAYLSRRSISNKILYPVCINYNEMVEMKDLTKQIQEGFGPQGLGIITIQGIPGYAEKREKLLPLARRLALLPEQTKAELESPQSNYTLGWSHGREQIEGQPDLSKASFYANPITDEPENLDGSNHKNIWPSKILPQLEHAYKDLGAEIIRVGALLAKHLDLYLASSLKSYPETLIHDIIANSKSHLGRLLHYYPYMSSSKKPWYGWHNDHGLLTGLTCSQYLRESSGEILSVSEISDMRTGLFLRSNSGDIYKAGITPDQLCFQIGETAQILSGGVLQAIPHAVLSSGNKPDVCRNSFALFMQPGASFRMESYGDSSKLMRKQEGIPFLSERWTAGITYGEFHKKTASYL